MNTDTSSFLLDAKLEEDHPRCSWQPFSSHEVAFYKMGTYLYEREQSYLSEKKQGLITSLSFCIPLCGYACSQIYQWSVKLLLQVEFSRNRH